MLSKKSLLLKLCFLSYGAIVFFLSGVASCSAETSTASRVDISNPSFDCNKEVTNVEVAICDSALLGGLDQSLSKIYKEAKKENSGVKPKQREWIAKRNKCKGNNIASCLEVLYLQRIDDLKIITKNDVVVSLPAGWKEFTHSEWVSALGLSDRCSVNENIKHIRFINLIKINNESKLLSVTCELGAYQDSHLVFILSVKNKRAITKEVVINELYFDNGWKQKIADKITGYISLDNDKNEFIVTRRYVGAWTCGYVAKYSLVDLLDGKALVVLSARADNDCDNGVRRDEWPVVDIIE